MEEPFDPYHTWLGISGADQPLHHYRLLGIELFEEDAEVISNVADARMAHIKQFQTGKHSKESQQILNEIAAAKVCLLNPEKKADYDADLREQLEPGKPAVPLPPPLPPDVADHPSGEQQVSGPPPVAAPGTAVAAVSPSLAPPSQAPHSADQPSEEQQAPTPPSVAVPVADRKQKWRALLLRFAVAMAVAVLFGLAAFQVMFSGGRDVADQPDSATTQPEEHLDDGDLPEGAGDSPDQSQGESKGPGDESAGQPSEPPDPEKPEPPPVNPPESPPESPPEEPKPDEGDGDTSDSGKPGETDPATPPTSNPDVPPPPEPATPKRPAVPGEETQRRMRREVRDLYDDEFDDAKTPAKKLALAKELLKQAEASKDDPAARFVALRMVSELATEAGDVYGAMGVAKTIEESYDIKPFAEMVRALHHATDRMPSGSLGFGTGEKVADAAMELAEGCVARGEYEAASRFADLAMSAARKTRDSQLVRPLVSRGREIDRLKGRRAAFEKAQDTLATKPDDPEANLTAGRWHCFERGEWEKGLPLLAKGSNKELAKLARQEMETPRDNPTSQAAVADGWWKMAENENGLDKEAAWARAALWYKRAMPSSEGLDRIRAKKRLETLAEAAAAAAKEKQKEKEATGGAVRPGNVALASSGATVRGVTDGAACLLDGNSTRYTESSGVASGKWPCEWTITFNKVYRLKGIRFKLFDRDSRYYRYAVATSPDGKKYVPLANCSQGQWRGWQEIRVPSRPVKSIKLFGRHNSENPQFHVVEFEAYCIIPE